MLALEVTYPPKTQNRLKIPVYRNSFCEYSLYYILFVYLFLLYIFLIVLYKMFINNTPMIIKILKKDYP